MACVCGLQHGQERASAVEHAAPANGEGLFPAVSLRLIEERSAAADTCVVEHQVHRICLVALCHGVAKAQHGRLVGDIADMRRHANAASGGLAASFRLGHVGFGDVAHRDVTTLGGELDRELAPHARTAARDDRDPAFERFHVLPSPG